MTRASDIESANKATPADWNVLAMLKLKNSSTLPEVITRKQVRQIILAAKTQRMRGFFWTADTERHSRIKAFKDKTVTR